MQDLRFLRQDLAKVESRIQNAHLVSTRIQKNSPDLDGSSALVRILVMGSSQVEVQDRQVEPGSRQVATGRARVAPGRDPGSELRTRNRRRIHELSLIIAKFAVFAIIGI